MQLVIYSLGGGHMHTHTYTYINTHANVHIRMEVISKNLVHAGLPGLIMFMICTYVHKFL